MFVFVWLCGGRGRGSVPIKDKRFSFTVIDVQTGSGATLPPTQWVGAAVSLGA